MRIGLSGRIGVGIMLFAAVADGASWLVRTIDDYPFDFYRQIDASLPVVFLFGLALLLPSISIAFQTKRAANLAKVSLTTVGPLPPDLQRQAAQVELGESAIRGSPAYADEILAPKLAFVPSPSHRKRFRRLGCAFLIVAGLLYACVQLWMQAWATAHPTIVFAYANSSNWVYDVTDMLFYILTAVGITLVLWPDVRETDELSLQGETRATFRGVVRPDRALRRLIPLMKPVSSLGVLSYLWLMVLFTVWIIFSIIPRSNPMGLMVIISMPEVYAFPADNPWLVLHIDAQRHLFLNRQPVPRDALEKHLRHVLSRLAGRTVFLDADPNLSEGDVIEVIDIIRGIWDTKVILVTPSMKKEKPQLAAIHPCAAQPLQTGMLKPMPKWNPDSSKVLRHSPIVSFGVGESGEVSNIKVRRSSGIREIDEWVVNSMRKWKYKPDPGCDEIESEANLSIDFY